MCLALRPMRNSPVGEFPWKRIAQARKNRLRGNFAANDPNHRTKMKVSVFPSDQHSSPIVGIILVYLSCHNKIPQTKWPKQNNSSLGSGASRDRFWRKPLRDLLLPSTSSQGLFSGYMLARLNTCRIYLEQGQVRRVRQEGQEEGREGALRLACEMNKKSLNKKKDKPLGMPIRYVQNA